MKIGRATIQPPTDKDYPQTFSSNNGFIDISGWHVPPHTAVGIADRDAFVQQWDGMRVGQVVPIEVPEDTKLDGFYVVQSIGWTPGAGRAFGYVNYSGAFQRIGASYANPYGEVHGVFGLRDLTYYGSTSPYPFNNLAFAPYLDGVTSVEPNVGAWVRPNDSGVDLVGMGANTPNVKFDVTFLHDTIPQFWYAGAATIERQQAGNWYPVEGRNLQLTANSDIRIGNGIVRWSINSNGFDHLIETWKVGTGWVTAGTFQIIDGSTTNGNKLVSAPRILVNDVTGVAVQFFFGFETLAAGARRDQFTVRLMRGHHNFAFSIGNQWSQVDGMKATTPTAVTASTKGNGIFSALDGNGVNWQLGMSDQAQFDLVNGSIRTIGPALLNDWYLTVFNGNSTADTLDDTAAEWWTGPGVTTRIVS